MRFTPLPHLIWIPSSSRCSAQFRAMMTNARLGFSEKPANAAASRRQDTSDDCAILYARRSSGLTPGAIAVTARFTMAGKSGIIEPRKIHRGSAFRTTRRVATPWSPRWARVFGNCRVTAAGLLGSSQTGLAANANDSHHAASRPRIQCSVLSNPARRSTLGRYPRTRSDLSRLARESRTSPGRGAASSTSGL